MDRNKIPHIIKTVLTKRPGYLCELLQKPNMETFISYAQNIVKDGYSLFELGAEKDR